MKKLGENLTLSLPEMMRIRTVDLSKRRNTIRTPQTATLLRSCLRSLKVSSCSSVSFLATTITSDSAIWLIQFSVTSRTGTVSNRTYKVQPRSGTDEKKIAQTKPEWSFVTILQSHLAHFREWISRIFKSQKFY